jgi:5-methylcytosine-specific restriction endonuclease McrA
MSGPGGGPDWEALDVLDASGYWRYECDACGRWSFVRGAAGVVCSECERPAPCWCPFCDFLLDDENRYWTPSPSPQCDELGAPTRGIFLARRTPPDEPFRWSGRLDVQRRSADLAQKVPAGLRFRILHRDGFRCRRCGLGSGDGIVLHVDHRIAKSRGGSNDEENLWTLCHLCNLGKGTSSLEQTLPYRAPIAFRTRRKRAPPTSEPPTGTDGQ